MNSENKDKTMQYLWKYDNMGDILKIWVKFLANFWKFGDILKILVKF